MIHFQDVPKLGKNAAGNFIKNPCVTFLVIFDEEIEMITVKNQPYVFALHQEKLYEIQSFSGKIIEINSEKYSRQDFNGAVLRMTKSPSVYGLDKSGDLTGRMGEILKYFQEKFNFSIELEPWESYGALMPNQTWSGAIGQLVSDKIDFGKSKFPNICILIKDNRPKNTRQIWHYKAVNLFLVHSKISCF